MRVVANAQSARIEKLSILGVRSFGPKKAETIQFQAPLTLIVGWNGSGKTTIIECLKYITTGELPPNSKTGGAFIHDPKLCGEKEVMAQVRVSFRTAQDVRMVATRSLQLTVKKQSRSQKALEGSLLIIRDGERTSVSSRVAEMDSLVPQYIGVSKAVLESVIFCHQDDSLWPMSEPSVLKKKFDEIFEALKYTKAIENIKILRKKQNEQLAQLRLIEEHNKQDKQKADKAKADSWKLQDEISDRQDQLNVIIDKIAEAEGKSNEAFIHASRFEQIVAQLNGKRITLEANKTSVVELEDNIKHMAETDAELQSMLDKYEERIGIHVKQQEDLRQEYSDLKGDLEDNRHALGVKQGEIGKYQAEKEQYERQLQKREALVKGAAKRHGIRGFDYDVTDKQVNDFMEIIRKMSRDQENTVSRVRQESQEELRDAQGVVNEVNQQKSALAQSKEMARSQIATNDKRIGDFQRNMDLIQIDEGGEANLKEKKDDTERRLHNATSDAESQRFEEQIQEAEATGRALDEKKEHLESELVDATKLASELGQIEYTRKELKKAQNGVETMKGVHGARIAKLVDPNWDPASLDAAFQRVLSQRTEKVKEAESRREITQSSLANVNFKLANIESEQKKKRSELQNYQQVVLDAISKDDIATFDEVLQTLEEQYEMATSDQAKFEANIEYMQGCLQTAENENICRLCRRTLRENKAEHFTKASFIARLETIIKKAQDNMSSAENVDDLFNEVEAVRNAKPSYELAIRLRNIDLPALQAEASRLSKERETLNKQLERHDVVIDDLLAVKQDVESLSKDINSLVTYYNQSCELQRQVNDLEEKQSSIGMTRDIDSIQQDLKKITDEGKDAKAVLSRLTAARDKSRNLINSLEIGIRDITAELNKAQSALKEKRALGDRIDELRSYSNEQRQAIRGFDKDIQDLLPRIEQAQARYDDINRRGNERVQRFQEEATRLSNSVRELVYAEQEINAYIDKGGPQQLARAQREIEHIRGEIDRIDEDIVQVTRQLKKIEETVRDTDNVKRSIGDNLRFRKAKRSLQALQEEITVLEAHNAEEDKDHYEREGRKWHNEWTKLTAEHASLVAVIRTKDDRLQELLKEIEEVYADAGLKYKESHIKVETTKAAVEDLGRYGGALDKAIMKYHTLKMEEINQIIEELWKNAYQGTDVDTIRIRSDNESARGNRSYNYRVVMVKQDTEMDMRGRCSAGQKVLASIVIRLALAECFGKNCGLIALDEPTTNLDQQNITGLAQSLSEIIKARRKQSNFQLIVITHDEQFLREMNCADYADVYWRVGRNDEQTSVIERQMISEVV